MVAGIARLTTALPVARALYSLAKARLACAALAAQSVAAVVAIAAILAGVWTVLTLVRAPIGVADLTRSTIAIVGALASLRIEPATTAAVIAVIRIGTIRNTAAIVLIACASVLAVVAAAVAVVGTGIVAGHCPCDSILNAWLARIVLARQATAAFIIFVVTWLATLDTNIAYVSASVRAAVTGTKRPLTDVDAGGGSGTFGA
jgi:hypothetical protein